MFGRSRQGINRTRISNTSGFQKTVFSFPCLLTLSNSSLACQSEDMGFFSSKQAEDNDVYQVTLGLRGGRHGGNDKSVVQVIRSRFVRFLLLVQMSCRYSCNIKTFFPSSSNRIFISAVSLVRQKEQRARRSTTATNHFISGWRLGSAGPIP